MSNVPAAVLLAGFTGQLKALIIGTNIGGLGPLIASMASLISFKYIAKENSAIKGKYFIQFTIANMIFLIILLLFMFISEKNTEKISNINKIIRKTITNIFFLFLSIVYLYFIYIFQQNTNIKKFFCKDEKKPELVKFEKNLKKYLINVKKYNIIGTSKRQKKGEDVKWN